MRQAQRARRTGQAEDAAGAEVCPGVWERGVGSGLEVSGVKGWLWPVLAFSPATCSLPKAKPMQQPWERQEIQGAQPCLPSLPPAPSPGWPGTKEKQVGTWLPVGLIVLGVEVLV